MSRAIVFIACLLACQSAWALKPIQKWALIYASRIGAADNLSLTEPAVIWQESQACTQKFNPQDPSYGCGGLLVRTASLMAGKQITAKQLIDDDKLNIQLSEKFLSQCIKSFGWARGLVCYNKGPDAAKLMTEKTALSDNYVLAIRGRMEEIKSFPISTD